MTARQLAEWEAYDRLEPIGREWRADFRIANLMVLIHDLAMSIYGKRGQKKESKIKDFMPVWDPEQRRKKQSVEEMKRILYGIAGRGDKRKKNKK